MDRSHLPPLPPPLRLSAHVALAGELATLAPQRQARLSCVRGTCSGLPPPRPHSAVIGGRHMRPVPDLGYFVQLRPRRRSRTGQTPPVPRPRSYAGACPSSHPYLLAPPHQARGPRLSPGRPKSFVYAPAHSTSPGAARDVPASPAVSATSATALPLLTSSRALSPPDEALPTPALGMPDLPSPSLGGIPSKAPAAGASTTGPAAPSSPSSWSSASPYKSPASLRAPPGLGSRPAKAHALPVLTPHTAYATPVVTDADPAGSYAHWAYSKW